MLSQQNSNQNAHQQFAVLLLPSSNNALSCRLHCKKESNRNQHRSLCYHNDTEAPSVALNLELNFKPLNWTANPALVQEDFESEE